MTLRSLLPLALLSYCGLALANALKFDIPAQPLAEALRTFADQARMQLVYKPEAIDAETSNAVQGEYESRAALEMLLQGTGLEVVYGSGNAATIRAAGIVGRDGEHALHGLRLAQTDPVAGTSRADEESREGLQLEEVIVTASKRQTNLQETPMSISVLGAEEIERRGLVGMGSYLSSEPSVSVLDQGAGQTMVVMRGLAANPNSDGPLVGIYLGETPVSGHGFQGGSTDIKMVDFERVELLRGPQGTLYGASSLGGTVRNIPVPPHLGKVEGSVRVGLSETSGFGSTNREIRGVVNLPVVEDTLAVRLVGYRFENSGYYRNVAGSDPVTLAGVRDYGASAIDRSDVGNDQYTGGRVSVLWKPVEKLAVKLNYLKQKIEQDGLPRADLALGKGAYLQRNLQLRHEPQGSDFGIPQYNDGLSDDLEISNLVLEYDAGWASLLSSSSWIKERAGQYRDLAYFFGGAIPWGQPNSQHADTFVEELRLVSQLSGPLQLTAGAYYEHSEAGMENWGIWGGDPDRNVFGTGAASDTILIHNFSASDTKQKALFGEVSYEVMQHLGLTLGARVFSFDREDSSRYEETLFSAAGGTASDGDGHSATYKASLDYAPDSNTLVYGLWSQGFRLGYSVPAEVNPACDLDNDGIYDGSGGLSTGPRTIDSDKVNNYELGVKRSFLERRLKLNGAAYRIEWKGIPIGAVFDFCSAVLNAGRARSQGVELAGSYVVNPSLLVDLSGSYVSAKLTEDAPLLGDAGDPLPGSPKYNFHAGVQYDFSVSGRRAFLRGDYSYIGGFYNNLQSAGAEIGDFGLLGVRGGVSFGSLGVELFVDNLTNEDSPTWIDAEDFVVQKAYLLRPRTVGMSIGYRF